VDEAKHNNEEHRIVHHACVFRLSSRRGVRSHNDSSFFSHDSLLDGQSQSVFRYGDWWRGCWTDHHGAASRCGSQDRWVFFVLDDDEGVMLYLLTRPLLLPCIVHDPIGSGELSRIVHHGKGVRLQGFVLPSGDSTVHVPRWGLYQSQWYGR
jgi:hypothetical protein